MSFALHTPELGPISSICQLLDLKRIEYHQHYQRSVTQREMLSTKTAMHPNHMNSLYVFLSFSSLVFTKCLWTWPCQDANIPGGSVGQESTCKARNAALLRLIPGWEDPLGEGLATTPVLLPGESHGQRSLVGYSPYGWKESDTAERMSTHTSYSYVSESLFIHTRKTRRIQALTERVMECHLLVCLSALMVIVKIFSDLICEIVVCLKYLWFIIIDYSFCCFIYFLFFGYATKHIESHLSDQGLNPGSQVLVAQSCPTLCNSIDCIFGEDIFY